MDGTRNAGDSVKAMPHMRHHEAEPKICDSTSSLVSPKRWPQFVESPYVNRMARLKAGAILVASLGATVILYTYDPSVPATYPTCPSKQVSGGFDCPGCGTLRMLHNLLHGRFSTAFFLNPLAFIFLPLIGYFVLNLSLVSTRGRGLKRLVLPPNWSMAILIVIVIYGVGRNFV